MISSFGRGFDSLQLHDLENKALSIQSFIFFLYTPLVSLFFTTDRLFSSFLDKESISYTCIYVCSLFGML